MVCRIHFMHHFLLFYFLMVALVDCNGVINKCINKERDALLHFKASLDDPGDILSTWRGKEDCCVWSGVGCDNQTGHVTKLDLPNPNSYSNDVNYSDYALVGEVSPSLVNLTYLNYLDLSYHSFHGTIPTFIGSMTKLRYLDLSSNSFNGTIPKFFGFLTELWYLNLEMNYFHGIIPPEFGNLTNLQDLWLGRLGSCTIENIDWLSHLSQLESLDMSEISLAKANHWVNGILSLKNLSGLYLQDCDLSQVMHPYVPSFLNTSLFSSSIAFLDLRSNSLGSLYLSYNMLDGIPKYLGNLCSLAELDLSKNSAIANFSVFLKNLSGGCTPGSLNWLDVSSSQFQGALSDEIQKFSLLETLDISHNQLEGTISSKLFELPLLDHLYACSNSFRGVLSGNNEPSSLSYIDLSSCKIGPRFPKSIQTPKGLNYLDISNNEISDAIPLGFWNMWPSQLKYLNVSCNNISGDALDLASNFDSNPVIGLSSNNFSGRVQNVSSGLVSLNLSRNKFYGGLSFLCQIIDGKLSFLDLSHNSFSGQIPDCLWHFDLLLVLILGDNNLSGRLPNSLGYLVYIEVLHLHNNNFFGELPLCLKNCTNLRYLNFGANRFFGNVPVWIGENLPELYILSLGSNNFFGTIPLELCQLAHLQILDLSMNHLNGSIPACLNNFTLMASKGISPEETIHPYGSISGLYITVVGTYVDRSLIQWQGNELEFTSNLRFLKSIDLSSNNLTGQIPNELTDLHELVALNLSMNALVGDIPRNISRMMELLVLDLSRNNFSGTLPSSMSEMSRLDYLDVSYNNLSRRIPSSTQLQSFEPSRYAGNTRLCGPPISKYCPGDEGSETPPTMGENEGDAESVDELERWFYIGGAVGFTTGFWIICSFLLLYNRGRHVFFQFLDSLKDWIYVKVMLFISKS